LPQKATSFVLIQKKQKIKSAKRLLALKAFAPQIGQNLGLESFAPLRRSFPRFCKSSYAPATRKATLFCPLSPEAVLPDAELRKMVYPCKHARPLLKAA
jgi:hypothetical protein